eukprot:gene53021-70888_t
MPNVAGCFCLLSALAGSRRRSSTARVCLAPLTEKWPKTEASSALSRKLPFSPAITAQIGVMRVTEELDAMRVMGIPHGFRLVMPRVLALAIAMPLISLWTSMAALAGGMLAADIAMDISPSYFVQALPAAVKVGNLGLAMAKSVVFGACIALIGCHWGLRVKPNTQSLGEGTTASVVSSITMPEHIAVAPGESPIVDVCGLWSQFGKGSETFTVHQDLNFSVQRGEMLSLVGGSGTGKTVLLRQILGLARPTRGQVTVLGRPASEMG